jgi:hypothetical protein
MQLLPPAHKTSALGYYVLMDIHHAPHGHQLQHCLQKPFRKNCNINYKTVVNCPMENTEQQVVRQDVSDEEQ